MVIRLMLTECQPCRGKRRRKTTMEKKESLYSSPVWTTVGEPPVPPYQNHADGVVKNLSYCWRHHLPVSWYIVTSDHYQVDLIKASQYICEIWMSQQNLVMAFADTDTGQSGNVAQLTCSTWQNRWDKQEMAFHPPAMLSQLPFDSMYM